MNTSPHALRTLLIGIALSAALATLGCDGATDGSGGICDPGATQQCVCPEGSGAQSCNESGSGWDTCVCTGGSGNGRSTTDISAPTSTDAVTPPSEDAGPVSLPDTSTCDPYCVASVPFICDANGEAVAGTPCGADFYCQDGVCVGCEGVSGPTCEGDTVVSVDACGQVIEEVEDCTTIGYCSEGECVEACLPQHEKRCVGNDVYWFDSCGGEGGQAEACDDDEFCDGCKPEDANCSKEGQCVKASLSGTWSVTANPSSQSVMGGDVPFLPAMVSLQVDGTDVTGYAEVGVYVIDYVGTLIGKNLKMTGEYVESSALGDINHVEFYDVHFSDQETFTGLNSDTFTVPVLGDTTIYWTVTGVRQ